jgi:hypothetical protein
MRKDWPVNLRFCMRADICNHHWSTKLIRPPAGYTSRLKRKQLREYGDTVHQARAQLMNPNTGKVDTTRCVAHSDNPACYEEDHLNPLEDGGNPTDPRNLWPQPYNTRVGGTIMGARQKDVVEGFSQIVAPHNPAYRFRNGKRRYCNLAYSALASLRTMMSGSASFQRPRN